MSDGVVLSVRGATKVYPGTQALKGVDFDVRAGSVNVLVGENGAGKSTLMKIIAGVEQPTDGEILLDGVPVTLPDTAAAARHGIGIVFQELNLFPNMTIAENIFIGRERTRLGIDIDAGAQNAAARALLARLEHANPPETPVGDLRIGEQQIVEIAKALAGDARILILDEPTSALSATEVEILFGVIRELKSQGVAIVYISHRLEELVRIGDFITVLRDGRITGARSMAEVDVGWIVRAMIGSSSKDFAKVVEHEYGPEILRVEDMTLPRKGGGFAVDHVSLSLRAGEIVGIYGLMGAGRTELFDCIMGREPLAAGRVTLDGRELTDRSIHGRIKRGIALIPEDRKAEGLVHILSVAENMTMSSLKTFTRLFHLDVKRERASVREFVQRLAVKVSSLDNPVSSLSGGNQQKIVIGKALMTGPKVLLMDEPSRGIDIGAKAEVFRVMRELAAQGLGILFVTSDLEEVMELSDRIVVMSNGRVTGERRRSETDEGEIVALSAAGHAPAPRPPSVPTGAQPMTATHPTAAASGGDVSVALLLLKARTFIALIAVVVFFSVAAPNFLSTANLIIMSEHVALNAFLAIGMTFVIITGGIDLSVGSIVGLCGMVAGYLVLNGVAIDLIGYTVFFNTGEIVLITLGVGILVGAVNGLLITKLNVAPFIATLGTLYVARGLALLSSGGATFPNLRGSEEWGTASFPLIGAGSFLGIPVSIWMLIAVGCGAAYLAARTPLGRAIYAVGGNERAAALSGLRVNRTKMFVYMFSGFCAAIVGLIVSSQLVASHPATGETFELNAIAAAVLGGTSMSGGRGRIAGTIVGAFVIGILSDGLVMMGVSSFWQTVIKGLVIIAAVVVDQFQQRLQQRIALQRQAALGR